MNSEDIRDQFAPLLDGELAPDERAVVESALAQDAELLRELDSLKRVDDLYRGLPKITAPDHFEQGIRERLHPKPISLPRQLARRKLWPALTAAALFAVLAGAVLLQYQRTSTSLQMASAEHPRDLTQNLAYKTDAQSPAAEAPDGAMGAEKAIEPELFQKEAVSDLSAMQSAPSQAAPPPPMPKPNDATSGAFDVAGSAAASPPMDAASSTRTSAAVELQTQPALKDTEEKAKPGETSAKKLRPSRESTNAPAQSAQMPGLVESDKKADTVAPPLPMAAAAPRPATPAPEPANRIDQESSLGYQANNGMAAGGAVNAAPASAGLPAAAPAAAPAPAPAPLEETGSATAAAKPSMRKKETASPKPRRVADRDFMLREGVWYESGYADETAPRLKRDADATKQILATESGLDGILGLPGEVVFKVKERWYRLEK